MINEGIVRADVKQLMKTEMIRELHELGSTTPLDWQHAVFKRCTGGDWEELDWDFEDNKAGAFLWTKSFDQLIVELMEDGFVRETRDQKTGQPRLEPVDTDPNLNWSKFVYPARPEK